MGLDNDMRRLMGTCLFRLMLGTVLFAGLQISVAAEKSGASARPKLYDPAADGKEQIAAALKTAKAENKRVILKFGANW